VLWGGTKLTGASSVIGVMTVGGGADSVRAGDAVLAGLDAEDNRVALCDLWRIGDDPRSSFSELSSSLSMC
jgi:hypothetical protein